VVGASCSLIFETWELEAPATLQRDDGGEDVGNLLRCVEFAPLFAGSGGKLADQVFIGIAQCVDVRGGLGQPLGDFLDDGAELGVAVGLGLAQLGGAQVNLGEQALEGALSRGRRPHPWPRVVGW